MTTKTKEGYFVEWQGDNWQSVFPSHQSDFSQLHVTFKDALVWIQECVGDVPVEVLKR